MGVSIFMKKLFQKLMKPSRKYPIIALVLVGAVIAISGVIAMNKTFEVFSSTEFCTSCHTMQQNYEEYKQSIHYSNAKGIRAECVDCHQPKDFVGKVWRKMGAATDLYHHFITGKIDTPEKFEEHRLELAQKVWDRMADENYKTCTTCHSYDAMDHSKQSVQAMKEMIPAAKENMACVECHKGIAHELPNMAGGFRKTFETLTASAVAPAGAKKLYSLSEKSLFANADATGKVEGQLLPASEVIVLEEQGDMLKIRVEGWIETNGKGRVMTEYMGKRVFKATVRGDVKATEVVMSEQVDAATNMSWKNVAVEAWVTKDGLLDSIEPVWDYASEMYASTCNSCHAAPAPGHFTANGWISSLKAMSAYYRLNKTEERTLLKYLQNHGSDTGGAGAH
ncbi:trimethylamine N-oxide reductase cytochrome c-type subunit [Enterovibrio norvegicus]|uniref:Cytochrome c-type protein n=3 Tax=Enterovibrio norvegicus TaxID=188144 RepID=A0A1I5XAP6_9GAMM|nr:pentaheme c-type cytochrome TorC [Enterovibrio norvegicus]OEE46816.1 trimethylamine N-oxide reductase cytochrome c-type subunit [Enterovibrio norvegicus]OEF58249.1 trimethylamine N-oxide reductase cytochrome c-type subunit [Enterovibrio norvegicus]OEF59985.1 trimethylamine N-oxide reductase cytochrome c-type subunit [Enterovibrio norvegicus]SFQ29030.1 trimethylamine-N-oxide reductase (cytochrome c), cytochrome c-type subunit TorC [Enterovibrio norvegicus DSM 15893]